MYKSNKNYFVHLNYHLKQFIKSLHSTMINNEKVHPFKMKSKKVLQKQQRMIDNITVENQYEMLSDMIEPHWRISYDEELNIKQEYCKEVITHIQNKLSNVQLKLDVGKIIPSPVRECYRSKNEFSVWPGLDGNPKTVGFFIGSPAVGSVCCVPPTHISIIKESHKKIAQMYQDYIRASPLPGSYQLFDGGFWRNIVIRSNDDGHNMALIITNPLKYTQEEIVEQEQKLKAHFFQHTPDLSLFHQSCPHLKCSRLQAPINHLNGEPYVMDSVSGRKFRISPDSFFQLNKLGAEIMYDYVLNTANLKPYTTLLDLYSGAGGLSILASDRVRGCMGIEEVEAAVEDATFNAKINNITNCVFKTGKVEMKLQNVLKKLEQSADVVAVVNPGRGGANESVISLLRQSKTVNRVVYVSCKPDNPLTLKNFIQLCERVSNRSKPFTLTKVQPIDLFPCTTHCELVLTFHRI